MDEFEKEFAFAEDEEEVGGEPTDEDLEDEEGDEPEGDDEGIM